MSSKQRKRDFALTGNYETEAIRITLVQLVKNLVETSVATYVCYGEEVAPTTGQKHLQAYIRFRDCKTKSAAIKILKGFHVTLCVGDPEENIRYCAKTRENDRVPNEVFVEFGTKPAVLGEDGGQRTKEMWLEYKDAAKEGRIDDIDGEIFIKHYSSLKRIERDYMSLPADLEDTCGIWYYGDTGTGKSHAARAEFPGAFLKRPNKWWDGYQGQDSVIVDDIDKSHKYLGFDLKIWADKYAYPGEVKGTTIQLRPKNIIVTSNYHPREIFHDDPQILDPICRRFRVTRFADLSAPHRPQPDHDEEVRPAYSAVEGFVIPQARPRLDSIPREDPLDIDGTPPYSPPAEQWGLSQLFDL